ncbi:DNA-packaging protein [Methylobacterium sp. J-068]|uniref:DNA-packaging protein n=1 Tax=Methylobacterium sp. J-068 TaxID=2836649 RepID=UPI001FB9DC14|nr:terminase family protein [Methylobacterium sp. J-068]MCJ2033149.1 terminase family protein [Methylobacterium sp. J-068]
MPALLESLPPHLIRALATDWLHAARDDQLPPCPARDHWTTWAVIGGRGAGKTRTGAEWVRALALGDPAFTARPVGRIALVGETFADVRDVMVDGPSGLLALAGRRPSWSPSRRRLEWDNGAIGLAFSAEEPDSLRGPQFGAAWSDEIAKWRYAEATYDMIQFGLRLGERPRGLVTTTPRPIPLLRRILADPRTVVSRARTADNAANLAPSFLDAVVGRYAGTRLGRQELDGEMIEDRADALWTRARIEAGRVLRAPEDLRRVVVAIDPPASSKAGADACGIVAAGLDAAGHAYVLADATLARASPEAWASAALALYHRLAADSLVVEVNQGGEMATSVLAQVDAAVPVTPVRATRGKYLRAEPVSVLYAQARVHHVGALPALEDELCDFVCVFVLQRFLPAFLQAFYNLCSRRVPRCTIQREREAKATRLRDRMAEIKNDTAAIDRALSTLGYEGDLDAAMPR